MSFRRSALDAAGGFAEGIGRVGAKPLGCEETELSIRIRRVTGDRIVYVPTARVRHAVPDERSTLRYFYARCWFEGVSKAEVAARVGRERALAAERNYVTRVLPLGIAAGVKAAGRGDVYGLARAGAIVSGLAVTSGGYLSARLMRLLRTPFNAPNGAGARGSTQ
jgi:hypothetical protein